jgi:hypothetical protein
MPNTFGRDPSDATIRSQSNNVGHIQLVHRWPTGTGHESGDQRVRLRRRGCSLRVGLRWVQHGRRIVAAGVIGGPPNRDFALAGR